jgi:hypothetical protein
MRNVCSFSFASQPLLEIIAASRGKLLENGVVLLTAVYLSAAKLLMWQHTVEKQEMFFFDRENTSQTQNPCRLEVVMRNGTHDKCKV